MCYDYSGYGLANGKPSEQDCYSDILAAHTYLVSHMQIPPNRIILFGRSLGSGPTVQLASTLSNNVAGVVLISAFTSCLRVVLDSKRTRKFDMFVNIDKVDRIVVPVLCVHGTADDIVPISHGVRLAQRARFALDPCWIRGAGHNNLECEHFQYPVFQRYVQLLEELLLWRPPRPSQLDAKVPGERSSWGRGLRLCWGGDDSDSHRRNSDEQRKVIRIGSSPVAVPKTRQHFSSSSDRTVV